MAKLKETWVGQVRGDLSTTIKQILKKQERMEQVLAKLLEGQDKMLELEFQSVGKWRRQKFEIQESQNEEWADRKEVEPELGKIRDSSSEQMAAMDGRIMQKQKATYKTLARISEEQIRKMEKEGSGTNGHMECQEFNCDEKKQEDKRKEEGPINFRNQENENKGGNGICRGLDLPKFDGKDPVCWLKKVEKCFTIYQLSEEEKREATVVVLEGEALLWYQWEDLRKSIKNWQELKSWILRNFSRLEEGDLDEHWESI